MEAEDKDLEAIRERLATFSDEDFSKFLAETMLGLSPHQIHTIQFAFWFCYIVEYELDKILQKSFKNMESVMGKTPKELLDFIKNKYKIKLEKVNPDDPGHDPKNITFNDKIDIVEKIDGKSAHTEILREIKDLRNDISHLRIHNLAYKGENLLDNKVKERLVLNYVKQALEIEDMEKEGGITNESSEEQKRRVDDLYRKWQEKQSN